MFVRSAAGFRSPRRRDAGHVMAETRGPKGWDGGNIRQHDAEVRAKGMTIFVHIDHAAGAEEAGPSLRPTDLFIFGDARAARS
jgi:hypothetical protein